MRNIVKRKEVWIGIGILLLGIVLVYINYKRNNEIVSVIEDDEVVQISIGSSPKQIELTITGELCVDKLVLRVPYGSTFGNIVRVLKNYTNDYSILQKDFSTRYLSDTNIVIPSSDKFNVVESIDVDSKININTASKEVLVSLYGIGDKRADKIIEYRSKKNIENLEELRKIIGVSSAVIEQIGKKAFCE